MTYAKIQLFEKRFVKLEKTIKIDILDWFKKCLSPLLERRRITRRLNAILFR